MPKNKSFQTIKNPHDRVFKAAMSDLAVAQSFFKAHLPKAIQKTIDWKTLALCSGSYVDKYLQEQHTDILYTVQLNDVASYLYVLVEHQSDPDELMAFRLLEYRVKIWRQHLKQLQPEAPQKLPLILPVVYYTGTRNPYPYSTDLFDCFEDPQAAKQYVFKPCKLIDLTQISDDELMGHSLAAGLELLQKHIHDRDMTLLLHKMFAEGIFIRILGHDGDYYEVLLRYLAEKGEVENTNQFLEQLREVISDESKRENVMTIADSLRQQGREQGIYAVAENMLKLGHKADAVAQATHLPKSKILELQNALKTKAA